MKDSTERKIISLSKDSIKPASRSAYIDEKTGQKVCDPVGNSCAEEIYPKKTEPRILFPVGNSSSEEILPHQMKQAKQQVCSPEGNNSEEKLLAEAKEESKDSKASDLNKYYRYKTEGEIKIQNQGMLGGLKPAYYKKVLRDATLYRIRKGIGLLLFLVFTINLPKILTLIHTSFFNDLDASSQLGKVVCLMYLYIFAISCLICGIKTLSFLLDTAYQYVPEARYWLVDSEFISNETKRFVDLFKGQPYP